MHENGTNIGNKTRCCDCDEKRMAHERTLAAMTAWLDKNQPDVFRRGLWDAIATANANAHVPPGAERKEEM